MALQRASGVLAHPTMFPSPYGIGDLGKGAEDFITFLTRGKQTLWQVLPLNPTGFGDSPYQSFSTFAGNPLLVSPDKLLAEGYLTEEDLADIPDFPADTVEYGDVIPYKNALLRKAFARFEAESSRAAKMAFTRFCNENADWLDGYSLFVALKLHFIQERENTFHSPAYKAYAARYKKRLTKSRIDEYFYGAVWHSWPADIAAREPKAVAKWGRKLAADIRFEKFCQYLFFTQWAGIRALAARNGIRIIGDIPIFVALDSADVWCDRDLFLLDENGDPTSVAGVPPDYFAATGQLWGNPLYDWDAHAKTGYAWWTRRVRAILRLTDEIRIDHFRGFESYWDIPYGRKNAMRGKWVKGPGTALFDALRAELGELPIIAEDLGIITPAVEKLRDDLGLPGMKVLQFGFDAGTKNLNMPHNFKTNNLAVYTGTHDNDTSMGWYAGADDLVRDQFRRYMNVSGEGAAWDLIRLAFLSIANYAVTPVQDVLSLGSDAQMNAPGIAVGNWQFRCLPDALTDDLADALAYTAALGDRNLSLEEPAEEAAAAKTVKPAKTVKAVKAPKNPAAGASSGKKRGWPKGKKRGPRSAKQGTMPELSSREPSAK